MFEVTSGVIPRLEPSNKYCGLYKYTLSACDGLQPSDMPAFHVSSDTHVPDNHSNGRRQSVGWPAFRG